jgi:glutamine phosphoribosylpyrophosphate amidotransferase
MLFAGKCVELEISILSKISQAQKDKHCMFSLIYRSRPKNFLKYDMKVKRERM